MFIVPTQGWIFPFVTAGYMLGLSIADLLLAGAMHVCPNSRGVKSCRGVRSVEGLPWPTMAYPNLSTFVIDYIFALNDGVTTWASPFCMSVAIKWCKQLV